MESIVEAALSKIRNTPAVRNLGLKVHARGGKIVLSGRVSSYYQKQLAQEAVMRIVSPFPFVNHIIVNSDREESVLVGD